MYTVAPQKEKLPLMKYEERGPGQVLPPSSAFGGVSGGVAVHAMTTDRMVDDLIADHVPDVFRIVLDRYQTTGTQAQELTHRAVHEFGTDRQGVANVRPALDAAAPATSQAKLQLRIPAKQFMFVLGKHLGIKAGQLCKLFPQ